MNDYSFYWDFFLSQTINPKSLITSAYISEKSKYRKYKSTIRLIEKGESMKAFKIKGMFYMGDKWQNFTKEVIGEDENAVSEQIYSRLGSKHRVKRAKIHISEVAQIKEEEITDSITLFKLKNLKGEKNG